MVAFNKCSNCGKKGVRSVKEEGRTYHKCKYCGTYTSYNMGGNFQSYGVRKYKSH